MYVKPQSLVAMVNALIYGLAKTTVVLVEKAVEVISSPSQSASPKPKRVKKI